MYIFFVIIGIFVAIGIIRVVAANKKNKEKAEAAKAKANSALNENEEFKKFLEYENSSSSQRQTTAASQPQPQRPAASQATYRSQSEKQQIANQLQQRYENIKRMQAEKSQTSNPKNIVTSSHHDSHCDISSHQDRKERYKVEYVPTMNSIGGKSTEGCEDHYNVRFVKLESEQAKFKELTPLQKAIVYGEVINEPAFKRRYR